MATGTGNLSNLAKQFSDENSARELLTRLRWPNGVACPHCGGADPYKLNPKPSGKNPARKGLYKCRACRKQFSCTTGTIFESTHVAPSKWLLAIHLLMASKKGISAHQLHRMLGVTYKAAWFTRSAPERDTPVTLGPRPYRFFAFLRFGVGSLGAERICRTASSKAKGMTSGSSAFFAFRPFFAMQQSVPQP